MPWAFFTDRHIQALANNQLSIQLPKMPNA